MLVAVKDLSPGDMIDVPDDLVIGTDNYPANAYEYAVVEQVGGGWADGAAGTDEAVIYTENFALPIVTRAGREVEVVGNTHKEA